MLEKLTHATLITFLLYLLAEVSSPSPIQTSKVASDRTTSSALISLLNRFPKQDGK